MFPLYFDQIKKIDEPNDYVLITNKLQFTYFEGKNTVNIKNFSQFIPLIDYG